MQELKSILTSRRELGLITILFLQEFVRGAFFLTFLPLYAVTYLGISVTAAGLSVSAHYLVETLCKGAAGWQLDKHGRPVLLAGLFLSFAALLLMKLFPSPPTLLLGSALFGLGVSPVWLAVITGVAPVQLKDRAARMGVVFAVWLAGGGSGPVVVNFFISRDYNVAFTLLLLIWALTVIIALAAAPGTKGTPGNEAGFSLLDELRKVMKKKAVTRILLPGMFLQTLAAGVLVPLLPVYAQKTIGLSPNQYALLLMSGGAAAAFSFLPMGRLSDRVRLQTLLGTGFGLSAASLLLFAFARGPGSACFMAALVGFSYAIVLPAWNNLLAKVIPQEKQATGWGIFATIEGLGVALGPAMGGTLADRAGMSAALLFSTGALAVMSCFYFLYPVEKLFVTGGKPT
ncbi:MAG: MFS transporter [Firmicutes bacterium]|nr:MFS transporter [Bacillota bacterium]